MTDAPELKPCPFCGGDARVFAPLGFENVRTTECSNCGSTGPWESKEAKAIAGWNTRVPTVDAHEPTSTAVADSAAADSVVNADLVEAVARAIHAAHMIEKGPLAAWTWEEAAKPYYEGFARAAIAAMQADAEPVADERAVCIAGAVDYAVANWSLVTAELKASRLEEVLGRYGMKIVADDRVSPPTSVDDSETGNTSDKLDALAKDARDLANGLEHIAAMQADADTIDLPAEREAAARAALEAIRAIDPAQFRGGCDGGS